MDLRHCITFIVLLSGGRKKSFGTDDALSDCVLKTQSEQYTGTVSLTNNGIPCQEWASTLPHNHFLWEKQDRFFSTIGSVRAAKNYCRNFGQYLEGFPFCYTTHPDIVWGYCTLRICNGTSQDSLILLTSPTGGVSSPDKNADGVYDNNVDIMWMIEATPMKLIRYQLLYLEIENSEQCSHDALVISEPDELADRIWLCSSLEPAEGETISNVMIVHFISDIVKGGAGFQLTFRWVEVSNKSCDELLEQPHGIIWSPDEDGDGYYDFNLDCVWTVEVAENHVILFQVLYVDIQYAADCTFVDFLKIADTVGPLLILCGTGWYKNVMETRTNVMYVQFKSNTIFSLRGFNMTYGQTYKTVDICGGVLRNTSGTVVAPDSDLDGQYDGNANCYWTIEAQEGYVIRYRINYIMIEDSTHGDCTDDFLLTAEFRQTDGIAYSKVFYCGYSSMWDNIDGETLSNVFLIEFHSDNTSNDHSKKHSGFNITYTQRKVSEQYCAFVLQNHSGVITSPDLDLDGAYDFNLHCTWSITVDPKNQIQYQIPYLYIRASIKMVDSYILECYGDYLMVEETSTGLGAMSYGMTLMEQKLALDEMNKDGALTNIWCGVTPPTEIFRSKTNQMLLTFFTDNRLSGGGFEFIYEEREGAWCIEELVEKSGWITAPDGNNDDLYDNNLFCRWHVKGQKGEIIEFEVMFVKLHNIPACMDHLQMVFVVYNFGAIGNHFDIFCGVRLRQAPTLTFTADLEVLFMSNRAVNDEGFLLSYKRVNGFNGSSIAQDSVFPPGVITNADLDNDGLYDYYTDHNWWIQTDPTKRILMKILHIDIEPAESSLGCVWDVLIISDTESNQHLVCGIGTKILLTSSEAEFMVKFVSDYTINRNGFSISFLTVDGQNEACGGVLTNSSGMIASIDEDLNGLYDNALDCLWIVRLSPDKIIIFKLLEMNIRSHTTRCDGDYLEVREEHKPRGKFCGSTIPAALTTEANVLYVQFVSDLTFGGKGFEAVYVQAEGAFSIRITHEKVCSDTYGCLLSEKKVRNSFLCDNYNDCPSGDDERFCEFRCPPECECYGLHADCSWYSACQLRSKTSNATEVLDIPSTTRGLDVSSNPRLYNMMKLDDLDLPFAFYLNLSDCEIEWFPRTMFFSMRELRTLDISYNKISRLTSNMFLHQTMLEKFVLVGNLKPLIFEPESFTGLSALHSLTLSKLHILYISKDTFANLDLDALKIVYSTIDAVETHFLGRLQAKAVFLNTTKIKTMFQSMFDGIQTIELFKTDDYKFCCVKPLVVPGDKCFPHQDEISSCDDLIRNEVLVPLIWLIGFISILTNGASLVYRFARQRKQLKRNYGIFVSHLAVSDSLMGIYLLIIAVADIYYRGSYIYHDEIWRESILCQMAGVVSLISSEFSVLLICLITLDRYLVVKYPLGQVRIKPDVAKKLALLVWGIVSFLAILPVALYPVFEGKFYSASGVCLALPITRARPPGWIYAFIIYVGFNFVACLLISAGQWGIYKVIKLSERKMRGSRAATGSDTYMTMKLLAVALTNVLCWLPICILGILALADNALQGEVYSWVAVVVLPINSSVNPVMYTLLAVLEQRKKKKARINNAEEQATSVIFTADNVDIQTWSWTRRFFWQYPNQTEGFSALSAELERDDLPHEQRLMVAKDVTNILRQLHDKMLLQLDLKLDDIFVSERIKPQDNVRMILRPKSSSKQDDYSENIRSLGLILEHILGTKQT